MKELETPEQKKKRQEENKKYYEKIKEKGYVNTSFQVPKKLLDEIKQYVKQRIAKFETE